MRAFFRRHRGLHIWLLSVCGVLALYFALRTVPGLMTRFSRGIIMPLERAVELVLSNQIPDAKTQIGILKTYALVKGGKL